MYLKKICLMVIVNLIIEIALFAICVEAEISKDSLKSMLDKGEKLVKGYCDPESVDRFPECREGIKWLEQVVQSEPNNVRALTLLLDGYRNISPAKGMEIARHLLRLDPQNGAACFFIGINSKEPKERVTYLRKAAALIPNNIWVHGELAWSLVHDDKEYAEAVSEMEKQIKINPDSSNVVYRVADELAKKGEKNKVKKIYQAYLNSSKPQRLKCGEFAHDVLQKYLNQSDIIEIYKEQCGGYAYYELAKREKDPKEKIRLLKKAAELKTENLNVRGELAITILQHEGDVDKAVDEMKQQIQVSPVLASKDLLSFAALLNQKGFHDKEVDIYETFLHSDASKDAKCAPFRKINLEKYNKYHNFVDLLEKTCK